MRSPPPLLERYHVVRSRSGGGRILLRSCCDLVMLGLVFACVCASTAAVATSTSSNMIVVGEASSSLQQYVYVYDPTLLIVPKDANIEHAHAIHIHDHKEGLSSSSVTIAYKDASDDTKCLLYWSAHELDQPATFLGPGSALCAGIPHGLTALYEQETNQTYLYHANNDQVLHKTTLQGDLVWSRAGPPPYNDTGTAPPYAPTWFACQPGSPFCYLADGYGSSRIYVLYRSNGTFTGHFFGGIGTKVGLFQTSHAISWDARSHRMIVSDRENHRFQYFRIDPNDPSLFDFDHETRFAPKQHLERPCNIRFHPDNSKQAIVPFLEGTVAILNAESVVTAVLNITEVMGSLGFLHPHDAHFFPNGDFVLVTWNPGRIGYFRRQASPATTTSTGTMSNASALSS